MQSHFWLYFANATAQPDEAKWKVEESKGLNWSIGKVKVEISGYQFQ